MKNILIRMFWDCPVPLRFVESTWAPALSPQALTGPHSPLGTLALATALGSCCHILVSVHTDHVQSWGM